MSDLTVYAEALIATVARAFYDDDAVCLVDVLLRDKFLRDDDMAPRLSLLRSFTTGTSNPFSLRRTMVEWWNCQHNLGLAKQRRHSRKPCPRRRGLWRPIPLALLLLLCLHFLSRCSATNDNEQSDNMPVDFLDENSVVLITGIAGFIGSELALALHRVYSPKKIIGVDSMDDGFGQNRDRTAEELGVFDFKRQRLFHVLQTVGSRCHFYRVDFRPEIPDYQDLGEVPVLDHIFTSHPDITHVAVKTKIMRERRNLFLCDFSVHRVT